MGLRSEKQRAQRVEILENAFAYMREHDGALPTMVELARTCRVSDATIFNYVGQRDALRSEWAHRRLGAACLAAAESGGSLRRMLRHALRDLRAELESAPALWLEIWSGATPVDPGVGRPGGKPPGEEDAGLAALIRVARERDELRADLPLEVQTRALVSAWLGALAHEARRAAPEPPGDDAWRRIAQATELVLDGLRKRNERVRMGAGAGRAATASPGT